MSQTVAVIEDDIWLMQHYQRVLERANFKVVTASHPAQAINTIDDAKPAVILLDMLLAGSSALVLLHELQSHADLAKIPVIIASNGAEMMTIEELRPYGVKRLIDKVSMHPDDIVAACRAVLL